jgi:hypothetical protein
LVFFEKVKHRLPLGLPFLTAQKCALAARVRLKPVGLYSRRKGALPEPRRSRRRERVSAIR